MIDDKGRCCGRKPIRYSGRYTYNPIGRTYLFCDRCGKSYEAEPPHQEIDRTDKGREMGARG